MAAGSLKTVVEQLHSLAAAEFSDAELVEQFVSTADEAAFAALVHRHGRLVHGVCRRVLGAGPDLEDVFQATFVLLARKVGSIRKQASVGSWLYGVAYHLATKLRTQRSRRWKREHAAGGNLEHIVENKAMHVDPGARAGLRELGNILDEELQRLPTGCRDALILCLMEGLSNCEAAQQLDCPLGTLKTRLQRGRKLLRQQLERRGVVLSAMALSVILTELATAAVPAPLLRATLPGALRNAISAKVAALADTGARMLAAWKPKLALFAMVAVSLIGFAAAAAAFGSKNADGPADAAGVPSPQAKEPFAGVEGFRDPLPQGALVRVGTARWRHGGPVNFVQFLPDGQTVVSAADDRFVRVWDFATGNALRRFGPGPRREQMLLAVAGGFKQDIERSAPDLVALSSDGKLLATRFDPKVVEVTEIATGKKVASLLLDHDYDAGALAFAPNGKRLAIIGVNGPIRLWDIITGKRVGELGKKGKEPVSFPLAAAELPGLLYAPDGKTLASVLRQSRSAAPSITFWDPKTGKELHTFNVPAQGTSSDEITSLVFSSDSKLFAYATMEQDYHTTSPAGERRSRIGNPEICLGRTATREIVHKWKVSARTSLAFAADSAKLYSKSIDLGFQEWDTKTGKLLRQLSPPLADSEWTWRPGRLAPSPDGTTLATAGGANTIRFIDLATGKDLPAPVGHVSGVNFVSYTDDSKSLATSGADSLHLWDTATGKHIKQFRLPGKQFHMTTRNGGYLAVDDRSVNPNINGISIQDATGKSLVKIPAGGNATFKGGRNHEQRGLTPTFFFSPDGRTLLVQEKWGTEAVLYEMPSGKERCRVALPRTNGEQSPAPATLFFSPDGRRFALYSYLATRSLTLHEAATGKALQKFFLGEHAGLRGGAFSADGRTLALDQCDGLVQLIELATGKVRHRYGKQYKPGPASWTVYLTSGNPMWSGEAGSSTVTFSPDGRVLAHVGMDNALHVWDVATRQALARFESPGARIAAVAFAPDGRSVATACNDTTTLIWDVSGLGAKAGLSEAEFRGPSFPKGSLETRNRNL